jgi:hypothetical protein
MPFFGLCCVLIKYDEELNLHIKMFVLSKDWPQIKLWYGPKIIELFALMGCYTALIGS